MADNEQESGNAEGKWNRTGFVCHNCTAHRWEHSLETENAAPSRVMRTHTSPQTHAGRARREACGSTSVTADCSRGGDASGVAPHIVEACLSWP